MPLHEQNYALQDQYLAFGEPSFWVGDQWSTDP